MRYSIYVAYLLIDQLVKMTVKERGVCVENLIILLMIREGWDLIHNLENFAACGLRCCYVLLCTSAECVAFLETG